jgi:hypothetical protein
MQSNKGEKHLTQAEVQAKADEISKEIGKKVHPIMFVDEDNNDQVIGYIREPERIVKLRVLDKSLQSPMTAAAECLEAVLLPEFSDERILSEDPVNDKIFIGAAMAALNIIQYSANQFKKK